MKTYFVPLPFKSLYALNHLIPTTIYNNYYYCHLHFTNEKLRLWKVNVFPKIMQKAGRSELPASPRGSVRSYCCHLIWHFVDASLFSVFSPFCYMFCLVPHISYNLFYLLRNIFFLKITTWICLSKFINFEKNVD